jgi:hypothetical protein
MITDMPYANEDALSAADESQFGCAPTPEIKSPPKMVAQQRDGNVMIPRCYPSGKF